MKLRIQSLTAIILALLLCLTSSLAVIVSLKTLEANAAFDGYGEEMSLVELLNASNTYNVSTIRTTRCLQPTMEIYGYPVCTTLTKRLAESLKKRKANQAIISLISVATR